MLSFLGVYNEKCIEKIISDTDQVSALLILRNEIWKTHTICIEIQKILENYKGEKKLGKKELLDLLNKKYDIEIQFIYLEFLLEILREYFRNDLSNLSDYFIPRLGV